MAALQGIAPTPRLFGATNAALSVELNALGEVAFATSTVARERVVALAGAFRPPASTPWTTVGRMAHRFAEDYFDRIHLTPIALSLGNVVSELTREIAVWNAWRTVPQTLTALRLMGDAGSTLTAPAFVTTPMPLRTPDFGFDHACSISVSSGQLVCWGENSDGQLGDGTGFEALPLQVAP